MILRRIGQAARRQDRFVVLVEVLVVIFGVFIGLQGDDWKEQRKDTAREQSMLRSLAEDLQSDIEIIDKGDYAPNMALGLGWRCD